MRNQVVGVGFKAGFIKQVTRGLHGHGCDVS